MTDGSVALVVFLNVISIAVSAFPDLVVAISAHSSFPGGAAVIVEAGVLDAFAAVVGIWNLALKVELVSTARSGQPGDLVEV